MRAVIGDVAEIRWYTNGTPNGALERGFNNDSVDWACSTIVSFVPLPNAARRCIHYPACQPRRPACLSGYRASAMPTTSQIAGSTVTPGPRTAHLCRWCQLTTRSRCKPRSTSRTSRVPCHVNWSSEGIPTNPRRLGAGRGADLDRPALVADVCRRALEAQAAHRSEYGRLAAHCADCELSRASLWC